MCCCYSRLKPDLARAFSAPAQVDESVGGKSFPCAVPAESRQKIFLRLGNHVNLLVTLPQGDADSKHSEFRVARGSAFDPVFR